MGVSGAQRGTCSRAALRGEAAGIAGWADPAGLCLASGAPAELGGPDGRGAAGEGPGVDSWVCEGRCWGGRPRGCGRGGGSISCSPA